ncbi:MAG: zinc ribbon domain-containing protein [Chitinivibrionales bacterium]|nr:zinc ribbon domain-containing protein [Chitinivibrionales bacterium]
MPIYEYKCRDCGKSFEELVSLSQSDGITCPSCSSKNTEKQMSVFGTVSGNSPDMPCAASCPSADSCGKGSCCSQFGGHP